MNLDDALKMATNTVVEPVVQNVTTPVAPAPVVETQQVQAPAQVVQPTYTTAPGTAAPNNYVSTPATGSSTSHYTPVEASMDLNQASQDAMQNYGVQTIQLGQMVSTRVIESVKKLEKGDSIRFTLIAPDIRAAKIHTHPTLGKISCCSTETNLAQCCQELGDPKVRYFMPVLVYSTMPNDCKTPLPQGKSELRLLVLWDANSYNQLCTEIMEANSDKIDIIATSEDTYGKLSFRGQKDSFRSIPEYQAVIQQAEAKWEQVKDRAVDTVRRNMDAVRYAQLSKTAAVPQMQDYSMNDVM